AELDALLRIAQGRLEGRLAHPDGAGGMGDAAALERPGHLLEAALAPAEKRRHRNLHVVESESGGLRGVMPGLAELPGDGEARGGRVDDEHADARPAPRPVGIGGHQAVVGDVPVRDEHLRPVDDVVVAAALRGGADRGGVGARVGLGEAEGAELLAPDGGHEVVLLLLLGAEAEDRDAAEPHVREERRGKAAVHARDLLDQETAHHHVPTASAVCFRIADAEVAEASELREEVAREGLRSLELLDARCERLLREAPDRETEAFLFVVQAKAEHVVSSGGGIYPSRPGSDKSDPCLAAAICYGTAMPVTTVERIAAFEGQTVTLRGWLAGRRSSGKLHFLQVRDGTGTIQCVTAKADVSPDVFLLADHLPQESSLEVTGVV